MQNSTLYKVIALSLSTCSLFQHYHLFQYLFTVDQEEENIAMEVHVILGLLGCL